MAECEKGIKLLNERRCNRMTFILAFDVTRTRHIHKQKARYPDKTEEEILEEVPVGKRDVFPKFEPNTVWPFECPIPIYDLTSFRDAPPPSHSLYQPSNLSISGHPPNPEPYMIPAPFEGGREEAVRRYRAGRHRAAVQPPPVEERPEPGRAEERLPSYYEAVLATALTECIPS